MAQGVEGSIFGRARVGAMVSTTNLDTGQTRQLVVPPDGRFHFARLGPGRYSVKTGGVERVLSLTMASSAEVDFGVEEVVVMGTRRQQAIDFNSVESNTLLTQEQIRAMPVAREINAVSLLAPGAVRGDKDLGGNLPSFGGASVAENAWYINGFDVTNMRNFMSYAVLPFDAIAQQQLKTGGYGAEYGRSLGGVTSLVTRRGTNNWQSGAAVYLTPSALRARGKDVENLDEPGNYLVRQSDNRVSDLWVNVYTGGPIVKDRLFVFALVEGQREDTSTFAKGTSKRTISGLPNAVLKLDGLITDDHVVEFTGVTQHGRNRVQDFTSSTPYSASHDGPARKSWDMARGNLMIGKYTGYLGDQLTVSALVGKMDAPNAITTGARVANLTCPVVLDVNLDAIGCWTQPFPGPKLRDPKAPPDGDTRKGSRFDAEWVLAGHTLRAGVDTVQFNSQSAGVNDYSGGYYYRYFVSPTGTVNGVANAVAPGAQYVRRRESTSTSGAYEVINTALYLEDSWKLDKNLLLYAGLRSESFNNKNADGLSFVKADNLLAPRLGFAWNVNGDATQKLFASAGRYYIPVASNTNIRMTHGELFEQRFYTFTGRDPVTQAPLGLGPSLGSPQVSQDGRLPNPATIADTQLRPMNQDELVLGMQRALAKGWNVGMKGVFRRVNDGMDDFCGHGALERWAADNGHARFDTGTASPCILVNPGRDLHVQLDLNGDGRLVPVTVPASYLGLGKYQRTYRALELTLEKPFDGRWGVNASYTWSKSRGTSEGYVNSTTNQQDSGITQDFDLASFTNGANGYLPNDRRHVFKLFGSYAFSDSFRSGLNFVAASGRPRSCIGFVPPTVADFSDAKNYTSASSYYCLNEKTRFAELVPRGSLKRLPWTYMLDVSFAYTPTLGAGKLTFQIDVFNLFNRQRVNETNEVRDYSRDTSLSTTVAADNRLSNNYALPTDFQTPRSVRLTTRYEF